MAYLDYALIKKETLEDVGNIIREKTGSVRLIDPINFASEIKRIPSDVDELLLQDKTITENGEYAADDGYYGFNTITVDIDTNNAEDDGSSIIDRTIVEYKNNNIEAIGEYTFYDCDKLENIECTNVSFINRYAFNNCTSLTNVNFPNLATIEYYSFYNCGLKDVYLPKLTNDNITNGYQFGYCKSLKSVNLPLVKKTNNNMFYYCTSLESVSLPKVEYLDASTFMSCSSLKNINLQHVNTINGSNVFYGCSSLEELELPMLSAIPQGYYLFYNMKNLKRLSLPSVISISNVNYLMSYNTNMETIKVTKLETISNSSEVFSPSVFNISLPSITSITSSGKVFYASGCTVNLRRIDLGHIQTISSKSSSTSDSVFYGMSKLLALIIRTESVVDITCGLSIFFNSNKYPKGYCYIYVPSSVIDNYKTTYSEYAQWFRAIEDYPDICSTDWNRSLTSVVTYHTLVSDKMGVDVLVGKNENALQIGNDIINNENLSAGTSFVGWCDTIDVSGEEDILTECLIDGRDITLHGLYKSMSDFICYNPSGNYGRMNGIALYMLPYVEHYDDGSSSTAIKYIQTKVTPPVEPDVIDGLIFVGWTFYGDEDFINRSNDDGTVTMDYLNRGNLEPMYNKGITFTYISNDDSQSITYDRYCLPFSKNLLQSLKIQLPDNMFDNPGYRFVAWAVGSETGTQYSPGDKFSIDKYNKNTEMKFYAIWEEDTI